MRKTKEMEIYIKKALNNVQMDSAQTKKVILSYHKDFKYYQISKKQIKQWILEVEQREMSISEIDSIIDKIYPTRPKCDLSEYFRDMNPKMKLYFRIIRDNFKTEIGHRVFLMK